MLNMSLLKSIDYLGLKKLTGLLLLAALLLTSLILGSASAAGSTAFTAEGASSAQTGTQFTAVVYVNPSGASFLNGQLTLNLSNLTFQSFSTSGNFASAAPVNGCSTGSTTCTLSFYNITSGVSTKTSVGTLTINATGAGGSSGQINLSGAIADDSDGLPMGVSTSNRTISITAPAAPTAPTAPPSGGGSGSGGSPNTPPAGSKPDATNPIDNPNPDSTVSVPNDSGVGEIVSEDQLSIILTEGEQDQPSTTVATTTSSSRLPIALSVGGLITLILVGVGAKIIIGRMNSARELASHTNGFSSGFGQTPTTPEVKPTTTEITPSDATNPIASQPTNQDGPVVISPDKKG